jgi:two-component system, sensor histidine kinase and response regulator
MSTNRQAILDAFAASLHQYVGQPDEAILAHAYELGRRMVGDDRGMLDLLATYHQELARLLQPHPKARERDRVISLAQAFLSESLASVAMAQRGFRDTITQLQREIAERIAAEQALRQSETRYRSMVETAQEGIWLLDADYRTTFVNLKMADLLGYAVEEMLGQALWIHIQPELQARTRADLALVRSGAPLQFETCLLHRDGRAIWAQIASAPLFNPDGQFGGVLGMISDITERKLAERALERAKAAAEELAQERHAQAEEAEALGVVSEAFASTLEPDRLYLLILEQVARVLPCNHAGVTLYENGLATFVATWGEPRIQPGTNCPMSLIWLPDANSRIIYLPDNDIDPRWHALSPLVGRARERSVISAPLAIDGRLFGSLGVSSRIPNFYNERQLRIAAAFADRATQALRNARLYAAEQQGRRAAEELVSLRQDFVASVSHELRTPLTSIIGFGELLMRNWEQFSEAKRQARVVQIVEAANRQKRLVDDLLLVSRLDSEKLAPTCVVLSIATLVQQSAAEVQGSYPGQDIVLVGSSADYVLADATRTVQVLANLLDNAAKYSPEGSPITVTWKQEQETVVVRVVDRGTGVSAAGRDKLFTRFGRVPGSSMRAGHVGTGLGLYLSREIAQSMGGGLDLESTGPTGTVFRLWLRRAPLA